MTVFYSSFTYMDDIIEEIREAMIALASEEAQEATRKFVPTSVNVYGLRMPQLNDLASKYSRYGWDLSEALWDRGSFEERMLAVKILAKCPVRQPEKAFALMEKFRPEVNDWAICDTLGLVGSRKFIRKIPDTYFNAAVRYLSHPDPWTIRLGLVLLIHFTSMPGYTQKVPRLVDPLRGHPDHYVKKAIVWIDKHIARN